MSQTPRVVLSCVLLVGALLALHLRSAGEAVPIRKPFSTFPDNVARWRAQQDSYLDTEILSVLRSDDYLMRRYVDDSGRTLWLFVGYWASQRKGAQIHSPRNCLPAAGWEPVEAGRVTIPVGDPPRAIIVNRYLIQKDRDLQLVLYWYQSQGQAIAGELPAKIEMVRSAMFRNRTDGALVRVSTPVVGGVPETTERLVKYVQALYPILGEYLPD
jgi:EpsI family protein